jgi:hypothetical protein
LRRRDDKYWKMEKRAREESIALSFVAPDKEDRINGD